MVTLWSEKEMTLRYPVYGDFRPGIDAAGLYRGCLLRLQRFAIQHLEYNSVINWEMDTRFTHTYDHLLESISSYAYHASAQTYTLWPIDGVNLYKFSGGNGSCSNKDADIIVFSPVRNPQNSYWYWKYDVQGFPSMQSTDRAASVGTNLWLSRRALLALENMSADRHQSMFCEAMALSLVFRSPSVSDSAPEALCSDRFKLVHYPHPVAFKYQVSPSRLDSLLKSPDAVLAKRNEEALKDTSFYYDSSIAAAIYRRWRSESDACVIPLLLHPVKSKTTGSVSRRQSGTFQGWLSEDDTLSICTLSGASNKCASHVRADI